MLRETWDCDGNLISSEPEDAPPVALMPLDILSLFTLSELLAIEQSTSLAVVAFRTQFFAAVNPIELTDARFLGALAIMETLGILTAERAAEVRAGRPAA